MTNGTKTVKLDEVMDQLREATVLHGLILTERRENLPININA